MQTPQERRPVPPPPPPPPPPPRPLKFQVIRSEGGFAISLGPAGGPQAGRVRAAYHVRRGDPFRRYDPLDFDFRQPPMAIEVHSGSILTLGPNDVEFHADEPDFRLTIRGFDQHRDVRVDVR